MDLRDCKPNDTCRYGEKCIDKSRNHRLRFNHPCTCKTHCGCFQLCQFPHGMCNEKNPDLSHLPKIPCKYGKTCYRKCPDHLMRFLH